MIPSLQNNFSSRRKELVPAFLLFSLLIISLLLLAGLIIYPSLFSRYQLWLFGFNIMLLIVFIIMVGINLTILIMRRIKRLPGSRLASRVTALLMSFALLPAIILYAFSAWMMDKGIETWFDVEVKAALQDALDLSRVSLNTQLEEYRKQVETIVGDLSGSPDDMANFFLESYVEKSGVSEALLIGRNQRIITSASAEIDDLFLDLPTEAILLHLTQGEPYLSVEPIKEGGLYARLVFMIPPKENVTETRILQVLYPVSERINKLATNVQNAYQRYDQLSYLRSGLKNNFLLVLTIVLLSSVFFAVWSAFFSARQVMLPITKITSATRAVAAGELDTKVDSPSDDLNILVASFNEMTSRLLIARNTSAARRRQLENERAQLQAVLANISSGVLSLDNTFKLKTANQAANNILSVNFKPLVDKLIAIKTEPVMVRFWENIKPYLEARDNVWEAQFSLFVGGSSKSIICHGNSMPDKGHVIVFNDITQLIRTQRETAWSEMAQRLAHEIKNPLTPIQLSAERLNRKLAPKMTKEDADVLRQSSHIIIEQVKAMEYMVDEFSQYSRPAPPQMKPLSINQLVLDVINLYDNDNWQIKMSLSKDNIMVLGDEKRLRQLLHNLLKNAGEAVSRNKNGIVSITTRLSSDYTKMVMLEILDNGHGFSQEVIKKLFEPYSTTKQKGKGLGLAIVNKIVEEHEGKIWAGNLQEGGAVVRIHLLLAR